MSFASIPMPLMAAQTPAHAWGLLRARQAKLLGEIREFSSATRASGERTSTLEAMDAIYARLSVLCADEESALRAQRHPCAHEHGTDHARLRAEIAAEMRAIRGEAELPSARAAHVFDSFLVHVATSLVEQIELVHPEARGARRAETPAGVQRPLWFRHARALRRASAPGE